MLPHPTIDKLQALHLAAMAHAFDQQRGSSSHAELSFEDRVGLLVEAEWTAREQRRLTQRLRQAKLRYPASLEDVDFTTPRGPDPRRDPQSRHRRLDSRSSQSADHRPDRDWQILARVRLCPKCRRHGFTATYVRAPRLLHDLAVSRGDGSYARLLAKLAKLHLLAIDDWLLASLTEAERRDLLEVIEDRSERVSTLIASQLPPTAWHAAIGEPTVADAICDRLIHRAHKLTLKGPTMRDPGTRRDGKAKP